MKSAAQLATAPGHRAADTRKRYRNGTHRLVPPAQTLARIRPLLKVMGITRIASIGGLDRLGLPVVMACRPNSRSIAVAQGKGLDLDAAKASAAMEAIETWHAETIEAPLQLASSEDLRLRARLCDVARLPMPADSRFHPDLRILWIEGEDLLGGGPVFLPYELVHTDYTLPATTGGGCFVADTNGLASGNHLAEAILHGLCEVIERDATALWTLSPPEARRGAASSRPASTIPAAGWCWSASPPPTSTCASGRRPPTSASPPSSA